MTVFFDRECVHAATDASDREIALRDVAACTADARTRDARPPVQAEQLQITQRTHPLQMTYRGMLDRCHNPRSTNYPNYGGRGIRVCRHWMGANGFWNFVTDMGPRPSGHTLDRVNVDGNYEPANCRWATVAEQNRNKRNSRRALFDGVMRGVAEQAIGAPVTLSSIYQRLERGMRPEDAVRKKGRAGFGLQPRWVPTKEFVAAVVLLLSNGVSHRETCRRLGVSRADFLLAIKAARKRGLLPPAGVSRAKAGPTVRARSA